MNILLRYKSLFSRPDALLYIAPTSEHLPNEEITSRDSTRTYTEIGNIGDYKKLIIGFEIVEIYGYIFRTNYRTLNKYLKY